MLTWLTQTKYIVFSEGKLKERQDEAISQVTGVLGIAPGEAARVLRQYKWCTFSPCIVCIYIRGVPAESYWPAFQKQVEALESISDR